MFLPGPQYSKIFILLGSFSNNSLNWLQRTKAYSSALWKTPMECTGLFTALITKKAFFTKLNYLLNSEGRRSKLFIIGVTGGFSLLSVYLSSYTGIGFPYLCLQVSARLKCIALLFYASVAFLIVMPTKAGLATNTRSPWWNIGLNKGFLTPNPTHLKPSN